MSELLLLNALLYVLHEKNLISDDDLKGINSVRDIILFLNRQGVVEEAQVNKEAKKFAFIVGRITSLYRKGKLNEVSIQKIESRYGPDLKPVFSFARKLCA